MTGERLFRLIKSLGRQQKSNFSRFVEARKGKRQKYLVVYDRMLACNDYEEETIRGKEFLDSRKYYQAREILADKLLQSLVQYESSRVEGRSYILRALDFEAYELAQKKFSEETTLAYQQGDFPHLLSLYQLGRGVAANYGVKLEIPEELPSSSQVRQFEAQSHQMDELLDQIRQAFRSEPALWEQKAAFLQSRLPDIASSHPRDTFRIHKIQVGYALLQGRLAQALHHQKLLVDVLEQNSFPLSRLGFLKEASLLIRLANHLGHRQMATESLMRLGNFQGCTPREDSLCLGNRIKASALVAASNLDLPLATQCHSDLLLHRHVFTDSSYAIHLLECARVYFAHGQYEGVLNLIEEVRSLSRTIWVDLAWVVDALRCSAHFELGNLDALESALLSAVRKARQTDSPAYPKLIYKTLHKLANAAPGEIETVLERAYAKFQDMQGDAQVQQQLNSLDFGLWLKAKLTGRSMMEIHGDQPARKDSDFYKAAL